jgi:predicted phosphate transport protein (TIGR00153 family)
VRLPRGAALIRPHGGIRRDCIRLFSVYPRTKARPIRQVAALPYRTEGLAPDAGVRVLLVTSRGTGRWVLPKGNFGNRIAPHVAAAREAEEEAGVLGAVCPVALGSYRYRKLRSTGASLMADVDVFPLAVTQEMDAWAEQHERERRWFTLQDAAHAVDEPDLRELLRTFAPHEFKSAASRSGMFGAMVHKTSGVLNMFAWFQRLLPRTGGFFEMFEAHAATVLAAAEATARVIEGGPASSEHIREVIEREHDADEITREVLHEVRRTFLTPFDRGAITALIGSLDDTVDEMQAAVQAIDLYGVTTFSPQMRDMAAIAIDAARLTAEAMPLLRDVAKNGKRLHELTERLVRIEGHADLIHTQGLKAALTEHGTTDTLRFIIEREIYKHLERIVDAFEDVADQIDGIVIDHS